MNKCENECSKWALGGILWQGVYLKEFSPYYDLRIPNKTGEKSCDETEVTLAWQKKKSIKTGENNAK